MDAMAAGVGVTGGGWIGEFFFLLGVEGVASWADGGLDDCIGAGFFLDSGIMGGNEGSDGSGDMTLFLDFGTLGGEESNASGDTAFLFLPTLALDPAGLISLIALAFFGTGREDVVSDGFSGMREAALKRADRLVDIMKDFDDCREKYLVDDGIVLHDRTRCSLIAEM